MRRKGSQSALSRALRQESPEIALMCVRAGANPNEPLGWGRAISAYDAAADAGVGELFAKRGGRGEEPLEPMAAPWRDLALALLDAGADPNQKDGEGVSALISAAIFNQVELIERLLQKGALIEHGDRYGNTALICAASAGSYGALEALLAAGANPLATGFGGQNAALRALEITGGLRRLWRARCVARLLEAGCDPDQADAKGKSARGLIERSLARARASGEDEGELRSALERWDMARAAQSAPARALGARGL